MADVAEAVTNHRPYRAALSKEKALGVLKKEKEDLRLDPGVVDICLEILKSD